MLLLSTQRELPIELQRKWININADTPAENRRWLQKSKPWWYENDDIDDIKSSKNNLQNTMLPKAVTLYSDEKMNWLRAYTALGEQRWTMTVYILAQGRIQKLVRNVDQYNVVRTVQEAVQAFQSELRL